MKKKILLCRHPSSVDHYGNVASYYICCFNGIEETKAGQAAEKEALGKGRLITND